MTLKWPRPRRQVLRVLLVLAWHAHARRSVAICLTGHLRTASGQPDRFVRPLQRQVLRPLAAAGYEIDIFAVTDAGEECSRARETLAELRLLSLRCVEIEESDEKRRTAEDQWLQFGPWTSWPRPAFLGQMKKVQICDELFTAADKDYSLVSRSRMDIHWHRFPADPTQLERPGVIWLPWRSGETNAQYIADTFAIGAPSAMKPYLRVYDELLDEGNWPLHRSFENSSDGLDTEELWQVALLKKGVLARQHLDICFNLLARRFTDPLLEREDNCRPPEPSHPNGYMLDTKWSSLPYSSLSGFFRHDPLLAARLLHYWFAEFARMGRPVKVVDLGCGRASMIERWLQYYPASIVGVDKMPGLRPLLGSDLLELDLTEVMNPRRLTSTRACTFFFGDEDLARLVEGAQEEGIDVHEAFRRVLNCCLQSRCVGLSISAGLAPLDAEQSAGLSDMIWLARRNASDHGQLAWAGRADWALLLDVVHHIPARGRQRLVANLDAIAAEGVMVSEPEDLAGELDAALASRGFARDRRSEELLLPWAMLRGVREAFSIRVFRRARTASLRPAPFPFPEPIECSLTLRFAAEPARCRQGLTFGCSNSEYIWVSDGCNGWFMRGQRQAGCLSDVENSTRSEWSYASVKSWQFVECYLPEGQAAVSSSDMKETMELCESEAVFSEPEQVHFPLEQVGPGHWQSEDIFISRYQVLQVRLAFDAVVQVSDMAGRPIWRARGWHGPVLQKAGRCVAWNVLPFVFYNIRFDIWNASSEDGLARLRSSSRENRTRTSLMPLAWEAADAVVRVSDVRSGGLLEVYDHMDPAVQWGAGQGGIWRVAGGASLAYRGRADAELSLLDDFAYLVLVVRMATAHVLGEVVSQSMVEAARVGMMRTKTLEPWGMLFMNLLARVMYGADEGDEGGSDDLVSVTDSPDRFRLQFSNTPLGRYLHHAATFASSD